MLQIKNYKISELKLYENNARTHSDEQIKEIADSIKEFGFNNPILIDENKIIIAGHGRLMAASRAGMKEVPTIELKNLSETKKRAYILADNRIALNAGWSSDKLQKEFEALLADNFDITLTGFTSDEINSFLNPEVLTEGLTNEDAIPEVKDDPVARLGDIWLLGNHRLKCANSTCTEAVDRLMNGNKPSLMVTDPPYGVSYDPSWRDNANLGVGNRSLGKVSNDDLVDWSAAYSLFSGNVAYVWHNGKFTHVVAKNLIDLEYNLVSQIIWAKNNFAISRGDYHWKHEPCWYAVKKGSKHNWNGARDQSTLWEINSTHQKDENQKVGHGTQKPVECMSRPIENNSKSGDYVYDPFGGSGTTLIACEKLGRKCLMMELSPNYIDVIIKRWQDFTGKKAILESTNQTFEEVSNACQEKVA